MHPAAALLHRVAPAFGRGLRLGRAPTLGDQNNLHWSLDATFKENLSRLRKGHGAQNMARVRHFALNLLRQAKDKKSLKRRRKCAAFDPDYVLKILNVTPVNLES